MVQPYWQGGAVPFEQVTVEPCGATTTVFPGGALPREMQPESPRASKSAANPRFIFISRIIRFNRDSIAAPHARCKALCMRAE
jgi:hypothetical protein